MARDLKFSAYKREVSKRLRNLSDEEAEILYNNRDKREMQIVAKVLGGELLGGFDAEKNLARGGRVGLAAGGMPSDGPVGFVERPPSQVSEADTVADDKPMSVQEGTFVINAPAVEKMGESDVAKMLREAYEIAGGRGFATPTDEEVDIAVSRGEVVIPPRIAKIIGYDRLEKINNRGKKEVKERIEENGQPRALAASGGFISKANGGEVSDVDILGRQYTLNETMKILEGGEVGTTPSFKENPFRFTTKALSDDQIKKNKQILAQRKKSGKKTTKTVDGSSAFGPLQITHNRIKFLEGDPKTRADKKAGPNLFEGQSEEFLEYIEMLKEEQRKKLNIEQGVIDKDARFGSEGIGTIPREMHEKHYGTLARIHTQHLLDSTKNLGQVLKKQVGGGAPTQLKGLKKRAIDYVKNETPLIRQSEAQDITAKGGTAVIDEVSGEVYPEGTPAPGMMTPTPSPRRQMAQGGRAPGGAQPGFRKIKEGRFTAVFR